MKNKKIFISMIIGFLTFVLLIVFLLLVDRQAIGPENSIVGLATLNKRFSDLVGVNFKLYEITDYISYPAFLILITFGLIGLIEWIKRKNMWKVDSNILALGFTYLFTLFLFFFFNIVPINYRPVLIEGELESSFPSSTTLLSIMILITAIFQIEVYIKNKKYKVALDIGCILYSAYLIVGRILSGVHWITDILGALILSASLVLFYLFLHDFIQEKTSNLK